jgi:hypothetical protein
MLTWLAEREHLEKQFLTCRRERAKFVMRTTAPKVNGTMRLLMGLLRSLEKSFDNYLLSDIR